MWSNVNGEKESFGEKEKEWFTKMRQAMGGERFCIDTPDLNSLQFNRNQVQYNFLTTIGQIELALAGKPTMDLAMPYESKKNILNHLCFRNIHVTGIIKQLINFLG